LVRSGARSITEGEETLRRVVAALGEPVDTGHVTLTHVAPIAARIAEAGAAGLLALGVQRRAAGTLAAVAAAVADGSLRLAAGHDVNATYDALIDLGVASSRATMIVQRALYWPDAFPASDPSLLRAAHAADARILARRAERWRPWRAYAATHLWLAVTR
jgi:AraC family transcriptional regulator of adaptative response / DNA-3-methyladenine glycosylase II